MGLWIKRNKILDKKTAQEEITSDITRITAAHSQQVEITSGAGRFRFLNGLLDEVKRERTNPE